MREPLTIRTMGCRWQVDLSRLDAAVAERVRVLWRHAEWPATDGDGPRDGDEPEGFPRELVVAHFDDPDVVHRRLPDPVVLARDAEHAPYSFSSAVTVRSITAQSGRMTLLHSAALAHPETGATVLLVAESGTGKTTSTWVLGRRLGYLSDETAAIRDDLTLIPHPKPLSIIPEPGRGKVEQSPVELGLLPAPPEPWLAAVVLLARDPGHGPPTLEPVPLLDAMADAIPQSSALPTQGDPLETLARVVTAGAGTFRLRYSEIGDAAVLVEDLLAGVRRGDRRAEDWVRHAPAPGERGEAWHPHPGTPDLALGQDIRLRRAPWRDAVEADGEILVLNGPIPVRLVGLGETIWRACATARSVAWLVDAVVADHGEHPRAADLVADAIRALGAEGLLRAAD